MKLPNSFSNNIIKCLIKILYRRADLIIVVSNGLRNELITEFKIPSDKIKVIYNPINITRIKYLASENTDDEWFTEDIPIIFCMGRLVKQKGHWHLIRAFSELIEKFPCKLIIRGEGELKPYLKELINDLSLTTR